MNWDAISGLPQAVYSSITGVRFCMVYTLESALSASHCFDFALPANGSLQLQCSADLLTRRCETRPVFILVRQAVASLSRRTASCGEMKLGSAIFRAPGIFLMPCPAMLRPPTFSNRQHSILAPALPPKVGPLLRWTERCFMRIVVLGICS